MQRIKKAYAENGDLKIIPETPPLDGSENWEQGRGAYFELDNDPNTGDPLALDIDREQDNYFKNVISKNIKHWQENTYPIWFSDIKYPKNAIIKYTNGNIYASKVDNNTALPTNATNWTIYDPSNLDGQFVKLTENQTIAGIKTFSSSPIVPTPTADFQSVPLKSTNITVNVGAGQTYTTINQALEYLSGFYPMYKKSGVTATINLKAGFVMAEQVLVSGIDLGWITIVGEDAETIITHTALTTAFYGAHYPAFGVDKGGTSPVIGQLFRFNVEKVGGNKHGLMTFGAGSSADVLYGKGFIGAGTHGIVATEGSTITADGANCSNAGTHGIVATGGSTITADGANCSNAGTHGIVANRGSTIHAVHTIVQNQTTGTARVAVGSGSCIAVYGINTTGGTVPAFSQAINTLTGSGIIYQ